MSTKYKFRNQDGVYFVSFAVVNWVDVFTRAIYKEIIADSIKYCQKEKGLILYAYVIMSNHIHLLMGKEENSNTLSGIMRDFKKFTAMQTIKAIKENAQESRKEWMLNLFQQAGAANSNNTNYQFWQQDNHPIEISNTDKIEKALSYIHDNPVEMGWVTESEDYFYSSARNYSNKESRIKVVSIYDGVEI